jgi:uncharacterized protein YjbI with pentapeptide repeats
MSMTEVRGQDLTGARVERVNLLGATFAQVFLNDASMHAVDLTGAQIRSACSARTACTASNWPG